MVHRTSTFQLTPVDGREWGEGLLEMLVWIVAYVLRRKKRMEKRLRGTWTRLRTYDLPTIMTCQSNLCRPFEA